MEIETLKKDNRKYWVIGIIITLILVSTIFFVGTRANYKVTQKVNIANGTINWNPSDLNIIAIKVQNSSGGYDNANSVPTSGYILNSDKSICKSNGIQQENIRLEYKNGYLKVDKINQKGTKCEFFFDIKSGISVNDILASKIITGPRISGIHTINTTGHISEVLDDDGISYLYTGAVDDNWVKFGGFYWRIIRINGDGTIRMIYNGTTAFPVGSFTTINNEASYYFGLENGGRNNNMYVG